MRVEVCGDGGAGGGRGCNGSSSIIRSCSHQISIHMYSSPSVCSQSNNDHTCSFRFSGRSSNVQHMALKNTTIGTLSRVGGASLYTLYVLYSVGGRYFVFSIFLDEIMQ